MESVEAFGEYSWAGKPCTDEEVSDEHHHRRAAGPYNGETPWLSCTDGGTMPARVLDHLVNRAISQQRHRDDQPGNKLCGKLATAHCGRAGRFQDPLDPRKVEASGKYRKDSEIIVGAVIHRADDAAPDTVPVTVELSRQHLKDAGSPTEIEEVVLDKGYHKAETLLQLEAQYAARSYVAEPKRGRRKWTDKPDGQQRSVYGNRRRIRGRRGRRLGRLRSERAERTFADVCGTGRGRRVWVHGVANVSKSHLMRATAHNLGVIMLALFGVGTARSL